MTANSSWENHAKTILKNEIRRQLSSNKTLAEKMGTPTQNLINKINRGKFSASFFLEALSILGVKQINIPERK